MKICKQCGYENPEDATVCEICAEALDIVQVSTVSDSISQTEQSTVDGGTEYFVLCPESNTKTILSDGSVKNFFCEGCKKEHELDGFLWNVESKEKTPTRQQVANTKSQVSGTSDNLVLEEVNSHFKIEIDKDGGSLGRYGKYGASYFQGNGLLMVSGEHCMITYEFGNWVLRHISRTNETKYNNMILGINEPNLLENGKILALANAVSFVVRIE